MTREQLLKHLIDFHKWGWQPPDKHQWPKYAMEEWHRKSHNPHPKEHR